MSKAIPYNANVRQALTQVAQAVGRYHPDYRTAQKLKQFGRDQGFLTPFQAFLAGALYKRVINGDKYVHHEWWTD